MCLDKLLEPRSERFTNAGKLILKGRVAKVNTA